jgi:hypothetical protein
MLGRIFLTSSKGLCVNLVLCSLILISVLACDNTNTASAKIKNETQSTTSVLNTSKLKKACELFTEEHAVALIGGDLEKDSTFGDQQETEDISLTTCSYSKAAFNIRDIKSATVVVRAAKNDLGRVSNKSGFLENKTRVFGGEKTEYFAHTRSEAKMEEIEIKDHQAYYDPGLKQLNILTSDENYWIMISGFNIEKDSLIALGGKILADF